MVFKITLDFAEADSTNLPLIQKLFQQWCIDFSLTEKTHCPHKNSAKGRFNKLSCSVIYETGDLITAILNLYEKFYDLGVQIYIHFVHEDGKISGLSQ